MAKLPSSLGSLIRPFQPTVVRGFSKYVRMTSFKSVSSLGSSVFSRRAYSSPASGSWIEQGPTTTTSRSSLPLMMFRDLGAPTDDGTRGLLAERDLLHQDGRREQRLEGVDTNVVGQNGHAGPLVVRPEQNANSPQTCGPAQGREQYGALEKARATEPAIRPEPARSPAPRRFTRGKRSPRGVVWFGVSSFWGHLRHFVSAAIATDDIDSRDWMTPDAPNELTARVARVLGGDETAPSLLEALGRDLWIDYVSDTGDDVSVSRAVARLVVERYELPDPDREGALLIAPRGEILLFGGDTAYPVATAQEITNRVLVPFNEALAGRDAQPRVLLGIPGNHDWYDGLDGFGRMFRRRAGDELDPRPSLLGVSKPMLEYYAEWGARVHARRQGGEAEGSGAERLRAGAERQLLLATAHARHSPVRSRSAAAKHRRAAKAFFRGVGARTPGKKPVGALARSAISLRWAEPHRHRHDPVAGLRFSRQVAFLLSGDVHHYERSSDGNMLHVIAGGGGAFLHPAPVVGGRRTAERRWPSSEQSRALLSGVPWKIARGRSGFLPHLIFGALFAPPCPSACTCMTARG